MDASPTVQIKATNAFIYASLLMLMITFPFTYGIPERMLHEVLAFFRGLFFFCDIVTRGYFD